MRDPDQIRIAIVGAGFSGIGLGMRLRAAGIDDFTILEKAGEVGGTWRENTYPGIACDVPSHLYSLSFAPHPGWSRVFSPGAEIQDYLVRLTHRSGIRPHLRLGTEVTGAAWDASQRRWRIETTRGPLTARLLIAAPGPLHEPALPDVPGIERFAGAAFHSAEWDHDHDLAGERVAVIGTGASAIQFVPRIQPQAGHLTVFQRTPPWVLPRRDRAIPQRLRRLYRAMPPTQTAVRALIYGSRELTVAAFMHPRLLRIAERAALAHLRRQVPDPELRARLTPRYTIGCKRILPSDDWYAAIQATNATLVPHAVSEIRERSLIAADGSEHAADTIIFGTGFRVFDMPLADSIRGLDGHALGALWNRSPHAYKGMTVPGFPNLFLMVGPNTGLGHSSIVHMIESQIAYVLDALRLMQARGVETIEVSSEAEAQFNAGVDARLAGSVWNSGGCSSYYLDHAGRNSSIWPGSTLRYRLATRRLDASRYLATRTGT